jgi:hypothetical protein
METKPKEVKIVIDTTYQKKRGEWTANIKLISVPEMEGKMKYGIVGREELHNASGIRDVVSKIFLRENEKLYLFAEDESEKRVSIGIDVLRDWPRGLYADTTRVVRGLITFKFD